MPSFVQECPICLDRFRDPVVTPCGHLSCGACMGTHVRASRNPYEATCPTCRAPFPIVTPDMSMIPKKYHVFISPSLRRIYLGDGEDTSRALIDSLNTEITLLKARVGTLKRDKDLLMDRCEAAQSAVSRLTSDERTARLDLVKAKEEARLANLGFESLKAAYRSLETIHLDCPPDTKRKSGQAALDSSTSIDSPSSSPRRPKIFSNGRPVKPMPKRARLQPTTTGPTAQKPPAPTTTPRFVDPEVVVRASVSFSMHSSSPSSSSQSASAGPSTTTARRTRVARSRYVTSSSSDSDESDGHSDVDDFVTRTRSRTTYPSLYPSVNDSPTPAFMRIVRQQRSMAG
ncbi:hypothetical protein BJY52DRAFT_440077 [Lactarius psammicola]|nr:hypothetical protein BJY52DRAFT_440077 [Lactarius psammicola]